MIKKVKTKEEVLHQQREWHRNWAKRNPDKVRKYSLDKYYKNKTQQLEYGKKFAQTFQGRYTNYKGGAKQRGLEFSLTKEQFKLFWQKNCSYCGGLISTIGLDRIDSTIGYTFSNVTSCCSICNIMKKNLPVEVFIEHCKKIINFNLPKE